MICYFNRTFHSAAAGLRYEKVQFVPGGVKKPCVCCFFIKHNGSTTYGGFNKISFFLKF